MADKTWSSLNKGAYSAAVAYTVGDFVSYEGGYYTCVQNTTGNAPTQDSDNDYWHLVASKGEQGIQGDQGIQGIQGATGPTGTSFIWKGAWSGATAYVVNDVVLSNGSAYICILGHTNHEPPNLTYWNLLAQKGLDGEGSGDVVGPASAVGNNLAAFDSTTGKLIKDSGYDPTDFATAAQGAKADTALQPAALSTHEADTSTHGVSSAIVGTTETQTLTNKTLTSPKINEDVVITSTATELNLLHGVTSLGFDGWIPANETWTYASATTITVPSGAAAKYQKGDKIKLTQTTVKYFYIVSVADTLLTITGGTTYTLANAAITLPHYSHVENPMGFPDWFDWTPTLGAGSPMTYTLTTLTYSRFSLRGRTCKLLFRFNGTTGGTASNNITFTLPITASNTGDPQQGGVVHGHDGNAYTILIADIGGTKTLCRLVKPGFTNFSLGGAAGAVYGGFLIYDIA
jgi:hypothetical protein